MLNGKIIKGIGGFYYVDTNQGLYECRARGIFRKNKITSIVQIATNNILLGFFNTK